MLPGRRVCLVGHPVIRRIWCRWSNCAAHPGPRRKTSTVPRDFRGIGQVPVTVNREIQRFCPQPAAGRAAGGSVFASSREGFISVEDLDHTVRTASDCAGRSSGPFETIELNAPGGIPDYCAALHGFYKELAVRIRRSRGLPEPQCGSGDRAWPHQPSPERIAALTQRRNNRLAALARTRHCKKTNPETEQEREQAWHAKSSSSCAVTGAIHTPVNVEKRCR